MFRFLFFALFFVGSLTHCKANGAFCSVPVHIVNVFGSSLENVIEGKFYNYSKCFSPKIERVQLVLSDCCIKFVQIRRNYTLPSSGKNNRSGCPVRRNHFIPTTIYYYK